MNKFRLIEKYTNTKIIALGGIDSKNLKTLKMTNVSGYSGITIFKKKRPLKKGPLNILDSK